MAAGRAVEAGGLTLQVAVPFRGTWQMKPSASHSTIVLPHTLPDPGSTASAALKSASEPFGYSCAINWALTSSPLWMMLESIAMAPQ